MEDLEKFGETGSHLQLMEIDAKTHRQTLGEERAQTGDVHWVPALGAQETQWKRGGRNVGTRGVKETFAFNASHTSHHGGLLSLKS